MNWWYSLRIDWSKSCRACILSVVIYLWPLKCNRIIWWLDYLQILIIWIDNIIRSIIIRDWYSTLNISKFLSSLIKNNYTTNTITTESNKFLIWWNIHMMLISENTIAYNNITIIDTIRKFIITRQLISIVKTDCIKSILCNGIRFFIAMMPQLWLIVSQIHFKTRCHSTSISNSILLPWYPIPFNNYNIYITQSCKIYRSSLVVDK